MYGSALPIGDPVSALQVGCTTLGMSHALLRGQLFDMCLMDEAGQITLPASLGPLLQARAFCLVGDPYQLPPLVQNAAARAQGLGNSLFRRLSQAHPQVCLSPFVRRTLWADMA